MMMSKVMFLLVVIVMHHFCGGVKMKVQKQRVTDELMAVWVIIEL